jgi:inorganic pyrophosphatase
MAGDYLPVDAIVETPRGSREEHELDPALGAIRLDRPLFSSRHYPGDYGFIVGTRRGDGDPSGVVVLVEEPTLRRCGVRVRPIGVLLMEDAKIVGATRADPRLGKVTDRKDLPHRRLVEFEDFFATDQSPEGRSARKVAPTARRVLTKRDCARVPSSHSARRASEARSTRTNGPGSERISEMLGARRAVREVES